MVVKIEEGVYTGKGTAPLSIVVSYMHTFRDCHAPKKTAREIKEYSPYYLASASKRKYYYT